MANYNEDEVIKLLKKQKGITIDTNIKVITLSKDTTFGNSISGKIDFLCNYKGYKCIRNNDIVSKTKEDEETISAKIAKGRKNFLEEITKSVKNKMIKY